MGSITGSATGTFRILVSCGRRERISHKKAQKSQNLFAFLWLILSLLKPIERVREQIGELMLCIESPQRVEVDFDIPTVFPE